MKTKVTMAKLVTSRTSWDSAASPAYMDRERRFYGEDAGEQAIANRTGNGKEMVETTEVIIES